MQLPPKVRNMQVQRATTRDLKSTLEHLDEKSNPLTSTDFFNLVDQDGSGTISRDEFEHVFKVINQHVSDEHAKEDVMTHQVVKAKRRSKFLFVIVGVLVSLVAVLLAGNTGLVYGLLEATKETRMISSSLTAKGSDDIVKTAEAMVQVPLIAAPLLPHTTLEHLKSALVKRDDGVREQYTVSGYTWRSNSSMTFHTTRGDTIELENGDAHLHIMGNTYGLCEADVTCSAFKVDEMDVDVDALMALVNEVLPQSRSRLLMHGCGNGPPPPPPSPDVGIFGLAVARMGANGKRRLAQKAYDGWSFSFNDVQGAFDDLCAAHFMSVTITSWNYCTNYFGLADETCYNYFTTWPLQPPPSLNMEQRAQIISATQNICRSWKDDHPNAPDQSCRICWPSTLTDSPYGPISRRQLAELKLARRLSESQSPSDYTSEEFLDVGVPVFHDTGYTDLDEVNGPDYWNFACEYNGHSVNCTSLTETEVTTALEEPCVYDSGITCGTNGGNSIATGPPGSRRRRLGHGGGDAACHPSHSTLALCDGTSVRIDAVNIGDAIRTPSGCEPVTGFFHSQPDVFREYYRLSTADASMSISEMHWLPINGAEASPATVKPGDLLSTPNGPQTVTNVETRTERGAYHILVASGSYYVDGIAASTYLAYVPHGLWKTFADGYSSLRYRLGVPLTPEGKGHYSFTWPLAVYEKLGMPAGVVSALSPFTTMLVVLTEVVNSLVVHTAPKVAIATLAAAAIAVKKA
jgi:hypothetical protein